MANLGGPAARAQQVHEYYEDIKSGMDRQAERKRKKVDKEKEKEDQKKRDKKRNSTFFGCRIKKYGIRLLLGYFVVTGVTKGCQAFINHKANEEIDRIQNYDNDYDEESINSEYDYEETIDPEYMEGNQPLEDDYANYIEQTDEISSEWQDVNVPNVSDVATTMGSMSQTERDTVALDYMAIWKEYIYNIADTPGFFTDEMKEDVFMQYYPVTDALMYGGTITMKNGESFVLSDLSESAQSKFKVMYYTVDYRLDNMNAGVKEEYAGMRNVNIDDINMDRDMFYSQIESHLNQAQFDPSDYHYQDFMEKSMHAIENQRQFIVPVQSYLQEVYHQMNASSIQL